MKVTYTAEDGETFDSQEDCLTYERLQPVFQALWDGVDIPGIDYSHLEALAIPVRGRTLFDARKTLAKLSELLMDPQPVSSINH